MAVAFALQAVAGDARIAPRRADPPDSAITSPSRLKASRTSPGPEQPATSEQGERQRGEAGAGHYAAEPARLPMVPAAMNGGGTANEAEAVGLRCRVAMTALLLLAACKPPTDARWPADPAAAKRGLAAIERVQCAACHEIKGVDWPKGRTGPSLLDYRRSRR